MAGSAGDLDSGLGNLMIKLHEHKAVKFGSFKLKSGIESPFYFDLRVIVSYPDLMREVSTQLWRVAEKAGISFDVICGVPYTALPIATCISVKENVPMLIRRKEVKDYGTKKMIEGHFAKGDTCLVIEDVVTSGTSVLETVQSLTKEGLVVKDAIVLLDREQGGRQNLQAKGINLYSLCGVSQLLDILYEAGRIDTETAANVRKFISSASQVKVPQITPNELSEDNGQQPCKKLKKMLTYQERAALCTNSVAKNLLTIMHEKRSNLAFSVDVTSSTRLLQLAESIGPYICLLKTHIDILEDFNQDFITRLQAAAKKHNFLIFEDRKFADIGQTVLKQYTGGLYRICDWAHIVNAHVVPGPGVIHGLSKVGVPQERGCLLIGEMSSQGCLASGQYTAAAVKMAEENSDFVMGFICQRALVDDPRFIHMAPGVQLGGVSDQLGQQYNSPRQMVTENHVDIIIVGRGILNAEDPVAVARQYQHAGFDAYEDLLQ
ncbi:Uridine 5'-monophosphate synthase [Lamellibrachia satsuma]|nr:Uridine 5'-monophosphate synthase [Lamellibrachia satsuma]